MRADPKVVEALGGLLAMRHLGRDEAATGEALRFELEREGFEVGALRRIGEAVEALIEKGYPICSTSALGYWFAEVPEDLEESLRESERRARMALRRRSLLKRRLMEMRGQGRLRTDEGTT